MHVDTRNAHRRLNRAAHPTEVWLFGYGSLIYKVDFPYIERRPASVRHWARRFWQGSHDHRGTPQRPGRVATLVSQRDAVCVGMAYLIAPAVFAQLDVREKNGYQRCAIELDFENGELAQGLAYIATAENAAFLGAAPADEIARHIAASSGPSGTNRDYLLQLAAALRGLGAEDPHVFAIERHLLDLLSHDHGAGDA
ncbi:MAG: gamma-glutamylcyclotransferase [Rhodanobacter sp.]